MAEKTAV